MLAARVRVNIDAIIILAYVFKAGLHYANFEIAENPHKQKYL
jgi:hypothetical protein